MAVFLSTFVNKVDRKGRVSVPATYRAVLGGQSFSGIVVFPSFRDSYNAIEACGMDRMERLSASVDGLNPFSDEHDDFATAIFGSAVQLPFDGEGRVMLPDHLRAHAGIETHAAFVGRGATFQIWRPEALDVFQVEARRRAARTRDRLALDRDGGSGGGAGGGR